MVRRFLLPLVVIGALVFAVFQFTPLPAKIERKVQTMQVVKVSVPKTSTDAISVSEPDVPLDEVNWPVPFTSQAPTANWDPIHEDACEEASVAMVLRYFDKQPFTSPADADVQIQYLVELNEKTFGYDKSQTAKQVVEMLEHESDTLDIAIVPATQESMKQALSKGSLIIVPATGKDLKNPYFQNPPPVYHMLVARGYTSNGYVITNDPGTKRGEEFAYTWSTLLNSIHDWNDGDVDNGAKVVIVISRKK